MTAAAMPRRRLGLPEWLPAKAAIGWLVAVVVLYAVPFLGVVDGYTHNLLGLTFMYMAAAMAWNWLGGYVGQISFGHSALFGVGAFVAAQIALSSGAPFWAGWLAGGLAASAYALAWGHPTLRLRGPYFSIATIGVGEATRLVATYWNDFTGGSSGLSLPLTSSQPTKYALYWYGLYLAAAVVAVSYALRRSRIGLGLLAIKEDVQAAGDVGVNATLSQDLVLMLSGFVIGVCGGFYASYQAFIDPGDVFSFDRSISFILMAVIGGIGTILGPIAGAVIYTVLQEYLLAKFQDIYLGLYGGLLVVIILFEPLGLAGLVVRLRKRFGRKPLDPAIGAGGMTSSVDVEGHPATVMAETAPGGSA